ncbi:alpha/beta hydrolase-fold protein [Wenyingzhuangia aestuarii]|uniref:alpha/beta hydrolase-fold protein n=1 Tax=Wenyingzhuangia aestuarii TaxID=1647582 RepID=UPI001439E537|nr:alpha/beta hydrolase-fold protein [Wenyingzhuangia aestuarii]NJB82054.1 enterochelin esterase-like enzyme [Wenyingzhuangia aestuarii]
MKNIQMSYFSKYLQELTIVLFLIISSVIYTSIDSLIFLKSKFLYWMFFLVLVNFYFIKNNNKQITINVFDVFIVGIASIGIIQLLFNSTINMFHIKIWNYTAYFITYFFLKIFLSKHLKKSCIIMLYSLLFLALINAFLGVFQYLDWIPSEKNKYFKVLGMFHSPNQLGLLISLGVLSLCSILKIIKVKHSFAVLINSLAFMFLLYVLVLTKSRGSTLALVFGVTILYKKNMYLFLKRISKLTTGLIGVIGLLVFIIVGKKLYEINPSSINGRSFISKTTVSQIVKNPWGYGIDSFAKEYNKNKAVYFDTERNWEEVKNGDFVFVAFNDFLELTFEMGVIWIVLLILFLITVLRKKIDTLETKIATSVLLLLSVYACTNSILVVPVFMIIFLFFMSIIIKQINCKPIFKLKNNIYTNTVLLIPLLFLLTVIPLRVYAEISLSKLKTPLKEVDLSKLENNLKYINNNGRAEFYVASELKKKGYREQSIKYLNIAFQKSGMPLIGRYLALEYLKDNNLKKAIEIFNYNKRVEPYRYEARIDLFNLYSKYKDISNAVLMAKEIIDLPIKIASLQVDSYKNRAKKYLKIYDKVKRDTGYYGVLSNGQSFNSRVLGKRLLYYVYQPPLNKICQRLPVLFVNDGVPYLRKGKLARKVDSLVYAKKIVPIIVVFIEPKDINFPKQKRWKTREELYLCNDSYSLFLSKELFPSIEKTYTASQNRSVLGLSFGGLSAAYLAIKNPNLFENVLLQSPAFHPCPDIYNLYNSKSKQDFKMYLSYGTGKDTEKQDLPFIDILEKKGYDLYVEKVKGGNHSWDVWEKQLNDILIRCYGVDL